MQLMPNHIIQLQLLLMRPTIKRLALRQHSIPRVAQRRRYSIATARRQWALSTLPLRPVILLILSVLWAIRYALQGRFEPVDCACFVWVVRYSIHRATIDEAAERGDEEGVLDVGDGGEGSYFWVCGELVSLVRWRDEAGDTYPRHPSNPPYHDRTRAARLMMRQVFLMAEQ